jgi:ribosome-associated protein
MMTLTPEPSATRAQSAPTAPDAQTLERVILAALDEDKAEDILLIDLKGKSAFADAMIIASGRSQRHVAALADRLMRRMKEEGFGRMRVEGLPNADWVLIDCGDVVTHLFRPEVRSFYNLERLWTGADTRSVA